MKHFTEYIRRHHNDRLEADTQELKLSDITAEEYKGFMAFIAIKKRTVLSQLPLNPKSTIATNMSSRTVTPLKMHLEQSQ